MNELKRLSVDEILDGIKQKKNDNSAKTPSSGAVDVDKLVAEILEEKQKKVSVPKELKTETVEVATGSKRKPEPMKNLSHRKKKGDETQQKEKFTVQIKFDDEAPKVETPRVEIEQKTDGEKSVSTVDLLAESLADQLGKKPEEVKQTQAPEPIVRIIPDDPVISADSSSDSDLRVDEPTKYIDDSHFSKELKQVPEVGEEKILPDQRAFEALRAREKAGEKTKLEELSDEDYMEYRTPEDEREVYTEILSTRSKLILRMILLAVFGGAALVLSLVQELSPQLLPSVLQKTEQPLLYLIIQFVLQIFCLLVCSTMVGEGLISAFKLRPSRDSLPAFAALVGLVQTVACFFQISVVNDTAVHFYTPVIAGILLCSCSAKLMMVNRMILNFRVITSSYEKYTTVLVDDENAAIELTRGSVADLPTVAVARKTGFITDFIAYSTDEDVSDTYAKYLIPVGFGFAVLLGVVSSIMTGSPFTGFTTAAAVACLFAPFSYLFATQAPLSRAAKKYNRDGGVILSLSELEDFSYTNAAVVTAHDLFPGNSVKLFGIKTFAGQRIDEALMDAASVIRGSNSVLANVFSQIIGGDEKLLRPVDSLVYEDGMGISAWVDNRRVLIGSRELMINHGISVPSRDYEERYLNEGHELIYLSTSGELTAVFLAKFFAAPEVKRAIQRLSDNGIHLTVKSVDAVITRQKLAEIFDEDPSCFKILPSRLHQVYDQYSSEQERGGSSVLSNGTFQSFTGSLIGAKRLRTVVLLGNIIQFAAVGLGLLLMIVLTLISGMSEMKVLSLFFYQVVWLVVTLLIPRLKSV